MKSVGAERGARRSRVLLTDGQKQKRKHVSPGSEWNGTSYVQPLRWVGSPVLVVPAVADEVSAQPAPPTAPAVTLLHLG